MSKTSSKTIAMLFVLLSLVLLAVPFFMTRQTYLDLYSNQFLFYASLLGLGYLSTLFSFSVLGAMEKKNRTLLYAMVAVTSSVLFLVGSFSYILGLMYKFPIFFGS